MKVFDFARLLSEDTGASKISKEVLKVLDPLFMSILALTAITLIVVILMQRSVEGNMNAISGGGNDTFYDKTKKTSKEYKLKIATIVLAAVIVVLSLIFFILHVI